MELKLENNLAHQTLPVDGVAAIVEASIQEPAKQSHQNPLLKRQLDGEALRLVRKKAIYWIRPPGKGDSLYALG